MKAFSAKPHCIPRLAEVLECRTDEAEFKDLEGGTLVMQMLLQWLRAYKKEKGSAQRQLDEGPRKALARKLVESINASLEGPDETELFLKLAKKLDFYGK